MFHDKIGDKDFSLLYTPESKSFGGSRNFGCGTPEGWREGNNNKPITEPTEVVNVNGWKSSVINFSTWLAFGAKFLAISLTGKRSRDAVKFIMANHDASKKQFQCQES